MIDISPPPRDPVKGHNYQPEPDCQFGGKVWRRFTCDCCGGRYITEVFDSSEVPAPLGADTPA
jgi:hypothetical protein